MEIKNKFPNHFLWGASTSAFQVEGGFKEGRGIANSDMRYVPSGLADYKIASDHYHHVKEDVHLMKELGIKVYRFSFFWSRIMPDGENVSEEGLRFYHELIDELIDNGIQPFPTLFHFEMPYALIEKFGGFKSRECVDAYEKYARICFKEFGHKVKIWATINEQMCATAPGDMNGNTEKDPYLQQKNLYQMSYHMSLAEKKAIAAFRDIIPDGKIGHVVAMQVIYPATSHPLDIQAAQNAQDQIQWSFLDFSIRGQYSSHFTTFLKKQNLYPIMELEDQQYFNNKPDFIGVNYYASCTVRAKKKDDDDSKMPPFYQSQQFMVVENKYIQTTEWMHFGVDSEGLYTGLREIYDRYQLPMIITENGMAYTDQVEKDGTIQDNYRIDYLKQHIEKCLQFVSEGYPLIGYCMWSFLDVVSSHEGFNKRYGLVYVDRTNDNPKSCKRIKKQSFYWYKDVIKNNGIEKVGEK